MSITWLIACDLDQTLIYSQRAFRLPSEGAATAATAATAAPDVVVVEHLDGEPLSYMTRTAAERLRALAAVTPVVPVTTRTLAQYRRIALGFAPAYAIAANGGHLLVDGVPDPGWEASVRRRLARTGRPLADIRAVADELAAAGERAGRPWVRTIRDADGFFVYLVATERAAIPGLSTLTAELVEGGWTVSVQGRKVYLVPAALTKETALAEVRRRTGATHLAAAGDSLLDLGMLQAADAAVRPAHGELHDRETAFASLTVTRQAGVAAGEEIVNVLRRLVTSGEDPRTPAVTFRVRAG